MLAKQAWRLLQNQDNLTSRLLKAKYYKEGNFLNCHLGARPSVAMRSIWNAVNKIRQWIDFDENDQGPVWCGDSNRAFSTKSVYMKLKEVADSEKRNITGEHADNRKVTAFWKIIWRLQVQLKAKLFAWRLYYDFLPSARNLLKKGCQIQSECAICGTHGESTVHSLLKCWWARIFWQELGVNCRFLEHNFEDPGDWVWFCAFNYSNMELGMIVQEARQVWFNRNLIVNGKSGLNPWSAARALRQRTLEYHESSQKWIFIEPEVVSCWQAPRKGYLKFNVDGAWDGNSLKVGFGVCGRDEKGIVWVAEAGWMENICSSQEAEAMALLRVLEITEERRIQKAVFETELCYGIQEGDTRAKFYRSSSRNHSEMPSLF
ncbi:hypothetical protein QQ045_015652 [Rhodiola kirilowii]